MTDHPRDIWVETTSFGDAAPRRMLAVDGREAEIAEAQDAYVYGRIDIDELEHRVAAALTPSDTSASLKTSSERRR